MGDWLTPCLLGYLVGNMAKDKLAMYPRAFALAMVLHSLLLEIILHRSVVNIPMSQVLLHYSMIF